MYTLYSRPGSGGFVAEAVLEMAGLPVTVVNVPKAEPQAEFLAVSPLGQVPALVLPDGRSMTESAAISILVADLYPEAGLSPAIASPARSDFLRWMLFMSSALYPALLRYFYADRYTTVPSGVEAVRAAALLETDRCFAIVEKALDGRMWLAGDHMSIADVYLLMLAHWHPAGDRPRDEWMRIVDLCARLRAHPVIDRLNRTHRFW